MIFRGSGSRLGAGGDHYPHPDFEGIKKRTEADRDTPPPPDFWTFRHYILIFKVTVKFRKLDFCP